MSNLILCQESRELFKAKIKLFFNWYYTVFICVVTLDLFLMSDLFFFFFPSGLSAPEKNFLIHTHIHNKSKNINSYSHTHTKKKQKWMSFQSVMTFRSIENISLVLNRQADELFSLTPFCFPRRHFVTTSYGAWQFFLGRDHPRLAVKHGGKTWLVSWHQSSSSETRLVRKNWQRKRQTTKWRHGNIQ